MSDYLALLEFAGVYFQVLGGILIAGGLVGYFKADSLASLIAGMISGLLLFLASYLFVPHLRLGLLVAIADCAALAGRFGPALMRRKLMPALLVAPLAVVGGLIALFLLVEFAEFAPHMLRLRRH